MLPSFSVDDIEGLALSSDDLRGNVTIVEFWATWCPPCRRSLPWLSELQRRHADDLRIVGVAVESDAAEVRSIARSEELSFPVILGTAELAGAFGDLLAVPTMFVFDRDGQLLSLLQGAPPDLHEQVEALVTSAIAGEPTSDHEQRR